MTRTELLNALSQIALDARLAFEDGDKEALIKKYDMPFGGESGKATIIYSLQLVAALDFAFGIKTSHDELFAMLPSVCHQLGYTLLGQVEPGTNQPVSAYCIDVS